MGALNESIERLIEQVRIANSYRFSCHAEKLEALNGQLSFFDEADTIYNDAAAEPSAEEVLRPSHIERIPRGRGILIGRIVPRKPFDPIPFPKKNWMPFTVGTTGNEFLTRLKETPPQTRIMDCGGPYRRCLCRDR